MRHFIDDLLSVGILKISHSQSFVIRQILFFLLKIKLTFLMHSQTEIIMTPLTLS